MKSGEYTPNGFPEIEIRFTEVEPRQMGTREQPELDPVVDIDDIVVHSADGHGGISCTGTIYATDRVRGILLDAKGEEWREEIIDKIKSGRTV